MYLYDFFPFPPKVEVVPQPEMARSFESAFDFLASRLVHIALMIKRNSSKIHTCQPQTVPLIAFFYWMSLNKWLNNNWWRRLGKRLLFNDIQSKRGNQRNGFWLARMNLATHSSRSNTVGFWFSSRASSGPFGWIFDWKVREESWIFWPLCCEVWKRSDAILGGKIAPALEPFQNKDSSLVLLLYGTVNGELKFIQNRSKTAFEAKGRLYTTGKVIQRLFIIDLYT